MRKRPPLRIASQNELRAASSRDRVAEAQTAVPFDQISYELGKKHALHPGYGVGAVRVIIEHIQAAIEGMETTVDERDAWEVGYLAGLNRAADIVQILAHGEKTLRCTNCEDGNDDYQCPACGEAQ